MAAETEICGDGPLSPVARLVYLWRNVIRNLTERGVTPPCERFYVSRQHRISSLASPSRALTNAYLKRILPRLLPPGRVRVLDIGCGSGRLCSLLADIGYCGEYIGLDVEDRFSTEDVPGFKRTFVCGDAHEFDADAGYFDLIISVSALEHIPDDAMIIERLPRMLAPGGMELHFVPSGWGIFVYLWHGYRQYTLVGIGKRFGTEACVAIPLGGLFSFLLHFFLITMGEILLPLKIRNRIPQGYKWLLEYALWLDRMAPVCPTMYVVRRTSV